MMDISDSTPPAPDPTQPTLTFANRRLLRAGAHTQILAGSMHYFRVHPRQWRDRLLRLVDLGLNTVDTYLAWNFHQPHEDDPADFTGWRDIGAFLSTAAEVGLDAVVRPGPYICAEWSNGGLPVWLTRKRLRLRTADPAYLGWVRRWFDAAIPLVAEHQANRGGNVIAVQVENEFGSFGDDPDAVPVLAGMLTERGITELMFTADGPTDLMLDAGTAPGLVTALTLGSKPGEARALARRRRPEEPFIAAEYWSGWFDHWGHPHHVRDADNAAATLGEILADGGSVSIYMAHGGTNFGLWAGANDVEGELRPTTTSYDSDAPIAEDGTLTEKFFTMRTVLGATLPVRSAAPLMLAPTTLQTRTGADLPDVIATLCGEGTEVGATGTADDLGAHAGFTLYRAETPLPAGKIDLVFEGVADLATVFVDGELLGTVRGRGTLTATGNGGPSTLTVLIEDLGRVNYGHRLGEPKGLIGPVLVDGRRLIQRWIASPMDPTRWDAVVLQQLATRPPTDPASAGISSAVLPVEEPRDTHLALPGFGRGLVWVNGFLLGRFWSIGPQQTLYVPAPLLRRGDNTVLVLDLEARGQHIEIRERPELGPEEQYVEEF